MKGPKPPASPGASGRISHLRPPALVTGVFLVRILLAGIFLVGLFLWGPFLPGLSAGVLGSTLPGSCSCRPDGSWVRVAAETQEIAEDVPDPESLFQEGNRRYQEEEFSGAVEAYQRVREAGFESSDLYYNLGNAYFKNGNLGRAILNYQRARELNPRGPDILANLQLARSLTVDAIEPMPRFWLFSVADWWANLLPRTILTVLVALMWLGITGGLCVRILSRQPRARPLGKWLMVGSGAGLLLFGVTLLAQMGALEATQWGIILAEEVAVQSAPSPEDDLTLFRIHEGTRVRLDQQTPEWSEIVLEDGRVGWVPAGSLEEI